MRRLYLQIYLAFVGILMLFGLLLGLAWWSMPGDTQDAHTLDGIAVLIGEALPADRGEVDAKLARLAGAFNADLNLRASDRTLIAAAGVELPPPPPDLLRSSWIRGHGAGPTFALKLPDGRWVVARLQHHHRPFGLLAALALMLVAIALGSYPLVRRITGRLERLQARVEALGAGDLKVRVQIEGRDEVADLARSFNSAAQRIEKLLGTHKSLLAHVSHELRTPLARMRIAVELLPRTERPELRAHLKRDIAELDELIGELLLASRLDAERPLQLDTLDLLALAAEEAAGYGVEVRGQPVSVRGDARLLRRLLRNLLENARRYAAGSAVDVEIGPLAEGKARIAVSDRGPGVPEAERERIFEPFYRLAGVQSGNEGVGLGLALVRQIARHHGGEARCLARAGGGSVFEVNL